MMNNEIWYDHMANDFLEALPVGGGSLGGMVYGRFPEERISLNKDDFWSGNGAKSELSVKPELMKELRNKIFSGAMKEANDMAETKMMSSAFTQSYMPIGNIRYQFHNLAAIHGYRRWLAMDEGMAVTEFEQEGNVITTEVFSSHVSNAIVVHIKSSKERQLSLSVRMDCPLKHSICRKENLLVAMNMEAPYHANPNYNEAPDYLLYSEDNAGMRANAALGVTCTDGSVLLHGVVYEVEAASEITICLSVTTGYNGYGNPLTMSYDELFSSSSLAVLAVQNLTYEQCRDLHTKDWSSLFHRMAFELEEEKKENLPMDERIRRISDGAKDISIAKTYFDFGRYLMIAASRAGSEPTTLQGIWSEKSRPEWSSNYTLNINTEMNYWMANVCNLYECEEPLVHLLKELSQSGLEIAKNVYCSEGWAISHNTDLWRFGLPVNVPPKHAYWPMGGVWLTAHLYNRYRYSKDKEFLLQTAYPIMKGAARFCLSWLCENGDGKLHTCPSTSPENSFYDQNHENCGIAYSSAMDIALIKELFGNIMETNSVYGNDVEFAKEVKKAYERLPEFQVGKNGQILEWFEEYEEFEPGHRHFSALYGLFPGQVINEYETPDLMKACEKLIQNRISYGGGHTGWSCAWLINLYARLGHGDDALHYLNHLFQTMTADNLFDLHPPLGITVNETEVFQIDGNLGAVSGISMMLVQSILDEIRILPALPTDWNSGSVKGLRTFNGFEIDITWKNGHLTEAVLTSLHGAQAKLKYSQDLAVKSSENENVSIHVDPYGRTCFETQAGSVFKIKVI